MLAVTAFAGSVPLPPRTTAPTYRVTVTNLARASRSRRRWWCCTTPRPRSWRLVRPRARASGSSPRMATRRCWSMRSLATNANVSAVVVGEHPVVSGGIPGAAEVPSVRHHRGQWPQGQSHQRRVDAHLHQRRLLHRPRPEAAQEGRRVAWPTSATPTTLAPRPTPRPSLTWCRPASRLVGVSGEAEGAGASNPELAEGGVISPACRHQRCRRPAGRYTPVAENPALIVVERIG